MKTVSAVRWVVLLTVLLSSCEVAAVSVGGRQAEGRFTKCERCGQTGPTIPVIPVVFRGQFAVAFEATAAVEHANLSGTFQSVKAIATVPVRDEFASGMSSPLVGAAVTR
jgi:hypothetical protein